MLELSDHDATVSPDAQPRLSARSQSCRLVVSGSGDVGAGGGLGAGLGAGGNVSVGLCVGFSVGRGVGAQSFRTAPLQPEHVQHEANMFVVSAPVVSQQSSWLNEVAYMNMSDMSVTLNVLKLASD